MQRVVGFFVTNTTLGALGVEVKAGTIRARSFTKVVLECESDVLFIKKNMRNWRFLLRTCLSIFWSLHVQVRNCVDPVRSFSSALIPVYSTGYVLLSVAYANSFVFLFVVLQSGEALLAKEHLRVVIMQLTMGHVGTWLVLHIHRERSQWALIVTTMLVAELQSAMYEDTKKKKHGAIHFIMKHVFLLWCIGSALLINGLVQDGCEKGDGIWWVKCDEILQIYNLLLHDGFPLILVLTPEIIITLSRIITQVAVVMLSE